MDNNFIAKLQTEQYLIGSFDAYLNTTKSLIKVNSNISDEEVNIIIENMPTIYRAAITDKNGQYIGYIGLFNVDGKNSITSIRFETSKNLKQKDKNEILNEFKKYLLKSLNITDIEEFIYKTNNLTEIEKKEIIPRYNVIIPNKLLIPGISKETLEKFSKNYSIPKLHMPFTIKSSNKIIGIIGLSNLIWPNKRANLNIFLDKSLGGDISNELSGYIIDDYINYVHESNVHNITISVNSSNQNMIDILNNTNMNYYGQIPFSAINGESIESNLMFQHIPNMKKENNIIPDDKSIPFSLLDTEKKELSKQIELNNGFKLVSPKLFEDLNIDLNQILEDHIKALQNRQGFTIPLGNDKYILQKGNKNYGIYKTLMNYNYIILNESNKYYGYISILRNNANKKNAEIEIAINPRFTHQGLGRMVINRVYEELFSIGYASVTSAVFEFNNPSLKLHEKVAELNGIRLDAYYINGKLWNMNFYSKTNDLIKDKLNSKQI